MFRYRFSSRTSEPLGFVENMATWRNFAALFFALTAASSRSGAQSQSVVAQPDVVVFWDAAKCVGGYHSDFYSAHCEPGPSTTILDFKTRMQFFCLNSEAVDIRWAIPADAKPGSPIPPSQIDWRPQCWKTRLAFEVDPNATILCGRKKPRAEWTDTGQQRARAGGQEIARQRQCRIVPSLNANGRPESRPTPRLIDASVLLKCACSKPMLVCLAFRTALPLPQRVGAFAEALMLRLMPELVGAAIRTTRLLPEQIGALANDLVKTRLRLRQHAMRISVWGQLAAAADMHLGVQTLEFLVGDQLRVARRLQRLRFERLLLHGGGAYLDRKRVQNLGALLLNVNQALGMKPSLQLATAYLDRPTSDGKGNGGRSLSSCPSTAHCRPSRGARANPGASTPSN